MKLVVSLPTWAGIIVTSKNEERIGIERSTRERGRHKERQGEAGETAAYIRRANGTPGSPASHIGMGL
jgi:hypothetical protein